MKKIQRVTMAELCRMVPDGVEIDFDEHGNGYATFGGQPYIAAAEVPAQVKR